MDDVTRHAIEYITPIHRETPVMFCQDISNILDMKRNTATPQKNTVRQMRTVDISLYIFMVHKPTMSVNAPSDRKPIIVKIVFSST